MRMRSGGAAKARPMDEKKGIPVAKYNFFLDAVTPMAPPSPAASGSSKRSAAAQPHPSACAMQEKREAA